MSLTDPLNRHALRYANETTRLFLMDRFRRQFPHLFQNATLVSRPATAADYYVPPSLAAKAVVVVSTALDEVGCLRLSCYPYKQAWEVCTPQDPVQWITIGSRYELACQPSCRDHAIHAEWTGGRCVVANPLKKMVATLPEKLFERRAYRHVFHGGLDVEEGHLQFNALYCEAYGLTLKNGECTTARGQGFFEFLLGMTPVRAALTARVQPYVAPLPPPPVPAYLRNYVIPPPPPPPRKRRKRATPQQRAAGKGAMAGIEQEIALELVRELGEQVTEWAVKTFLAKKAPHLLSKAVDRVAAKLVIKQAMAAAVKRLGLVTLKSMAKSVTGVTWVLAVYDLVIGIVDLIDPMDFNKYLSKADLEALDRTLDYQYFEDRPVRPELTPDYLWTHELLERDQSDTFEYRVERVSEYLSAVKQTPPPTQLKKEATTAMFVWQDEEVANWNRKLFWSLGIVALCVVALFIEWIDVWATCLLFFKLYYGV